MKLENFKNIIKGITQEDLNNDINVKIISAFGGSKCWEGKISEVLDVIKNEERCVNVDFYVIK
jgi:hypothetical protein